MCACARHMLSKLIFAHHWADATTPDATGRRMAVIVQPAGGKRANRRERHRATASGREVRARALGESYRQALRLGIVMDTVVAGSCCKALEWRCWQTCVGVPDRVGPPRGQVVAHRGRQVGVGWDASPSVVGARRSVDLCEAVRSAVGVAFCVPAGRASRAHQAAHGVRPRGAFTSDRALLVYRLPVPSLLH